MPFRPIGAPLCGFEPPHLALRARATVQSRREAHLTCIIAKVMVHNSHAKV